MSCRYQDLTCANGFGVNSGYDYLFNAIEPNLASEFQFVTDTLLDYMSKYY